MMAISALSPQKQVVSLSFCLSLLALLWTNCQSSKNIGQAPDSTTVQLIDLQFSSDSLPGWAFEQREANLYRLMQKDSTQDATWLIFIRAEPADPSVESALELYQHITSNELVTGDYRILEEGPVDRSGQSAYFTIDLEDQYATKKYYFLFDQTGYTLSYISIHSYATQDFFYKKLNEFERLVDLMSFTR